MGGYGSGRSGGRPTTEKWAHPEPFETPPRSALSARMRVGRLARMDEHHDRRARRLDRLRGPSRPGIGTRAAEVHDHPMGRGAPRVRLLDPARDNAPTLRRPAVVVRLPADGKAGGETLPTQRRLHLRGAPGVPARLSLASAKPLMTGRCGVPSSCGASSGLTAASETTSPSRSGCAGGLMTAPRRELTRRMIWGELPGIQRASGVRSAASGVKASAMRCSSWRGARALHPFEMDQPHEAAIQLSTLWKCGAATGAARPWVLPCPEA